jgi:small-conductance mechanosensitive channel
VDVRLVKFGDSTLEFELLVWVGPQILGKPGGTHAKLMWALEEELTRRGIEIPNPQRDIHIRSGSVPVRIEPSSSEIVDTRADSPKSSRHGAQEPKPTPMGAT